MKEEIQRLESNLLEIDKNLIIKEIQNIKNQNKILIENISKQNNEIRILKEEIKEIKILKEENKYLKEQMKIMKKIHPIDLNSVIIKEEEFDFIFSEIKKKLNKDIKGIKKIYQATIDGAEPNNFHSKCDNIPNTLTIIKSAGNKRIGGFTSSTWDSSNKYKNDKNAFIFSIDNHNIYSAIISDNAIYCGNKYGPIFGNGFDIWVEGNALNNQGLTTYSGTYGNKGEFLEVYYPKFTKALEIETFQILLF